MKKAKEIRGFFLTCPDEVLQNLVEEVFRTEVAANANYPAYYLQVSDLRKIMKVIVGWEDEDDEFVKKVLKEYEKEIEKAKTSNHPLKGIPVKGHISILDKSARRIQRITGYLSNFFKSKKKSRK